MNKFVLSALGIVAVGALVLGFLAYTQDSPDIFGAVEVTGVTRQVVDAFQEGFYAGRNRQLNVSATGTLTTTGALTLGSGGTAINLYKCTTATINPIPLGTTTVASSVTTTVIAFSGALPTDACLATLSSATTTGVRVTCGVVGNGSTTITVQNVSQDAAAIDLGSGTAEVCIVR